jgi:hypothetical protein
MYYPPSIVWGDLNHTNTCGTIDIKGAIASSRPQSLYLSMDPAWIRLAQSWPSAGHRYPGWSPSPAIPMGKTCLSSKNTHLQIPRCFNPPPYMRTRFFSSSFAEKLERQEVCVRQVYARTFELIWRIHTRAINSRSPQLLPGTRRHGTSGNFEHNTANLRKHA